MIDSDVILLNQYSNIRNKNRLNGNGSTFLGIAAFSLLYFLFAKFGMAILSLEPSNIALLWLPSGLALIMYLLWGPVSLLGIFLASFAANVDGLGGINHFAPVVHSTISALVDCLAGFLSAVLYNRLFPKGINKARELPVFVIGVCVVTTSITSALLGFNLWYGGYIESKEIISFIRMLILADSLGIILVFPVYQGWKEGFIIDRKELFGFGISVLVLAIIFYSLWLGIDYSIFFILPTLLVLSFKASTFSTGLITTISMIIIAFLTVNGTGPLVGMTETETNSLLVAFMFSNALTAYGLLLQNRQLLYSDILNQNLHKQVVTDPLTNLLNRRGFFNVIESILSNSTSESKGCYSIAMIDIDNFKSINDEYGHAAGDQVLRVLGYEIVKYFRYIDVISRIGGEEFAVFLPDCPKSEAIIRLDKFRAAFKETVVQSENSFISATVSIGVASDSLTDSLFDDTMRKADVALYGAKEKGKNQVVSI